MKFYSRKAIDKGEKEERRGEKRQFFREFQISRQLQGEN